MNKTLLLLIGFSLTTPNIMGQEIIPALSARVDTTKTAKKEIYDLYVSYLNTDPDKAYHNPNWNPAEYDFYLKGQDGKLDRSAYFLYYGMDANTFFKKSNPFVLQIDSISSNLYKIKTLFAFEDPKKEVIGITTLHAKRDINGDFKLQNTIGHITENWFSKEIEFIKFIASPNVEFDEGEALKAVEFCKEVAEMFDLEITPFTHFITSSTDELGTLYNFDYWLYGITGLSNLNLREVYTAHSNTNYPHEFVHILFPQREKGYAPKIIKEGIATWLAGPSYDQTYKEAKAEVVIDLKKFDSVTFDKIYNQEIRNSHDSNILYVAGAILCELAYDIKGKEAIMQLYYTDESTVKETLEKIFELSYEEIGHKVMNKLTQSN